MTIIQTTRVVLGVKVCIQCEIKEFMPFVGKKQVQMIGILTDNGR